MVNARQKSLIALLVLSAVVAQVGCGGGGGKKRQRVDRLLDKNGKPINNPPPKKDDSTTTAPDPANPGGETDNTDKALALLNDISSFKAGSETVAANALVGAGNYTLQGVTASLYRHLGDSSYSGIFHSDISLAGDVPSLTGTPLNKTEGKQGANPDQGKTIELAVRFELTAEGKIAGAVAKDLGVAYSDEKATVDFADGTATSSVISILNGEQAAAGTAVTIAKADDSTVRIQIEITDGSDTRVIVAEYKKTAKADPGLTNNNTALIDQQ